MCSEEAMLQKALHEKDPTLVHSASNESLFRELQQVAKAEPGMVSKSITSRSQGDRKEIVRILGHLPLIREFRDHPGERPERGERGEPLTARPRSSYSTRPQSSRPARPQSSGGRAQKGHTPTAAPHSARYVPRPPMSARKQAWDAPKSARRPESRPEESKQQIRRPATPREAAQEGRLRSPCPVAFFENQQEVEEPKLQAHEEKPPVQEEAWYQQAMKTAAASARLGFAAMPLEDEVPVRRDSEEAAARTRYLRKLAEVGIDPEGMTAGDILRLLYARDSSTTYRRMNKEAQKKLLVRVKTPLCMRTVLKEWAVQEVVAARDKPAEQVHECLDRWEIDTLAEVCRSLKYFDEEAAGQVSTYLRSYGGRQYMEPYKRKAYVRPPTA